LGYENVNLWFANNKENNIVTIDNINDKNKHSTYTCPVCGSEVIPSAIESVKVTPHFKHIDKSRCSAESQIHWWYKNKFIMPGDRFKIVSDKECEYICKKIEVEQEYKVGDKFYKPDLTIITESGDTIYFEMNYTNKKKVEDYLDLWLELKNIVVEIDIKQLMQRNDIPTLNALFYNGKCFITKKRDTYYNTIGKYKEEQYRNGIDEKRKEQIRKLDWFWHDIFRYKKGEVDIEYMADEIDAIGNKDDREIVNDILDKKMCNSFYKDYTKFLQYKLEENINDKIKKLNKSYDLKISYSSFGFNLFAKFNDSDFHHIGLLSHGSFSVSDIFNDIKYIDEQISCYLEELYVRK
jgi:transcription elongation factor Elf1